MSTVVKLHNEEQKRLEEEKLRKEKEKQKEAWLLKEAILAKQQNDKNKLSKLSTEDVPPRDSSPAINCSLSSDRSNSPFKSLYPSNRRRSPIRNRSRSRSPIPRRSRSSVRNRSRSRYPIPRLSRSSVCNRSRSRSPVRRQREPKKQDNKPIISDISDDEPVTPPVPISTPKDTTFNILLQLVSTEKFLKLVENRTKYAQFDQFFEGITDQSYRQVLIDKLLSEL
jgi:hypothetical protein